MAWFARSWFVAFFAALHLGFSGCGSSYPQVSAQADQGFMNQSRPVRTIDILPLDIQLWTFPGNPVHPEQLGQSMHALTSTAVLSELAQRGYDVMARMDWEGEYQGPTSVRQAMAAEEIDCTVYALSTYGQAVSQAGTLVTPYLPYRLGQETRSDATLYVGGWSYVGDDNKPSKGAKIAKGVAIGILLVAVIAVVILAAKSGGGGAGKIAGGAGRVAGGAGRVAVTAGRTAGRVTGAVLRGVARSGPDILHGMARTSDAFGRAGTHIEISPGRPDYFREDRAPKRGRSQMYLEMTLVDNATGNVLWHARQQFPANGAKSNHVRRAVAHMLATLPSQ